MDTLHIGDYIIRYDREATVLAYQQIEQGDADRCRCSYCRNFALQRPALYPPNFLKLLNDLGIDPLKEEEVFECSSETSPHYYSGWLFLSGELIQRGDHVKDGDFEYWFDDGYRPRPDADFGEHRIVVEFLTTLPWLLDEEA